MAVLDLSNDQNVLHNVETCVLAQSLDPGGNSPFNSAVVYRLPDRTNVGSPSDAAYLMRDVVFHWPTGATGLNPAPGDIITDAQAVEYIIQSVREPFAQDYWGLTTREVGITDDTALSDTVTLQRAIEGVDSYGSRVVTYGDLAGFIDVPAKIMLQPSQPEEYAGEKQYVERYDIIVDNDLPQISNADLIRDQDGKLYTIVSYRNRDQIDEKSVIECELKVR